VVIGGIVTTEVAHPMQQFVMLKECPNDMGQILPNVWSFESFHSE